MDAARTGVILDFLAPLPDMVARWEKEYPSRRRFDITRVKARIECEGCGLKRNLNRHHKGFDSLWARARPKLWAKRYIEFRGIDIIYLCSYCHRAIHTYALRELEREVLDLMLYRYYNPNHRVLLTKKHIEIFRRRAIKITNEWLNERIKPL